MNHNLRTVTFVLRMSALQKIECLSNFLFLKFCRVKVESVKTGPYKNLQAPKYFKMYDSKWNNCKLTITSGCLTLALWLNLLSLHLRTAPAPPKGVIGLSAISLEHTSCSTLNIFETRPGVRSSVRAVLIWESSVAKLYITKSSVASGTLGNSSKKLLVRRLLFFLHPLQRLKNKVAFVLIEQGRFKYSSVLFNFSPISVHNLSPSSIIRTSSTCYS